MSLKSLNILLDATLLKLAEEPLKGEPFADNYKTYPDLFLRLLRSENLTDRLVSRVFKKYAKKIDQLVDWDSVKKKIKKAELTLEDEVLTALNNKVWKQFNKDLGLAIALGIKDAIESGGTYTERENEKSVDWSSDSKEATDWVKSYVPDLVVGITKTTRKRMAKAIEVGITKSEPIPDISKRINFIIDNENRSDLIASTESVNAWNEGRLLAAKKIPGVKKTKTWRTVGDDRVSARDRGLDGQKVLLDADFTSDDDGWTGPRPTSHPRCRCSLQIEIIEKKAKK